MDTEEISAEAPYGYLKNNPAVPRKRRYVEKQEYEIFDMRASEVVEVDDDHPDYWIWEQHLQWQNRLAEACEEIQAQWTDSEYDRRRGSITDPLTFEECSMG